MLAPRLTRPGRCVVLLFPFPSSWLCSSECGSFLFLLWCSEMSSDAFRGGFFLLSTLYHPQYPISSVIPFPWLGIRDFLAFQKVLSHQLSLWPLGFQSGGCFRFPSSVLPLSWFVCFPSLCLSRLHSRQHLFLISQFSIHCLYLKKKHVFLFYLHECWSACMFVCVHHVPVPMKARRGCRIPWKWSYSGCEKWTQVLCKSSWSS